MAKKRRAKPKRPVFDSIRKPIPPNSQKFGDEKPEERVHPAMRKVKHKQKVTNGDFERDSE